MMWLAHIKAYIQERMMYRTEFLISIFTMMLFQFVAPLFTSIIYLNSAGFAGWGVYDVLLLQGIFIVTKGIGQQFTMGMIYNTTNRVQTGTFDLIFLKPRNLLYYFMTSSFDAEDMGVWIGGVIIMIFSLSHVEFTALGFIYMLLLMIVGLVLFFGISTFVSAITLRYVNTLRIYELIDTIFTFVQYPKSIYGKGIQSVFTGFIPLFIASFYPLQALRLQLTLGMIVAIGATIVISCISIGVWYGTIKKYTSAGG